MPKIPVDECPAGLAMDAAVAECLGWKRCPGEKIDHWIPPDFDMPIVRSWSTDIAAAWELAELCKHGRFGVGWSESWVVPYCVLGDIHIYAETVPLAICRAFLKARGGTHVEVPDEAVEK